MRLHSPTPGVSAQLVHIDPTDFGVDIDLIYARADNFTRSVVYDHPLCLLHADAALALRRAVQLAREWSLTIRVMDAFRSQHAQEILWSVAPDPDYVADPAIGSNHTRGVALDVTLTDARGIALDMGTPVDTMHPHSHHFCADHAVEVQINRMRLLTIMLEAGFVHHPREWWHYQLPQPTRYPLITSDPLVDANHALPFAAKNT